MKRYLIILAIAALVLVSALACGTGVVSELNMGESYHTPTPVCP